MTYDAEYARRVAHRRLQLIDRRLRRMERMMRWLAAAAAAGAAGHGVTWLL